MAISSAITDLFKSAYELVASLVGAVYTIIQSFITGVFGLFTGFISFIGDIFQGLIDVVGGVGRFVAGNFVILGLIAAGAYAYVHFTRQGQIQGARAKQAVGNTVNKKTN